MDLFINDLKPRLRERLLLKQPQNFEAAVRFARLKNATTSDSQYDNFLKETEEIRKMISNVNINGIDNSQTNVAAQNNVMIQLKVLEK